MSKELVRFLRCRIKRNGVINLILCGVRNLGIRAVNRRGGGINEMLDGVMPTRLKDIIKSDNIRLYINVGIGYRISYACLRGKVNNDARYMLPAPKYTSLALNFHLSFGLL